MVLRLFIPIVKWIRNKFMKAKYWQSGKRVKELYNTNHKINNSKSIRSTSSYF